MMRILPVSKSSLHPLVSGPPALAAGSRGARLHPRLPILLTLALASCTTDDPRPPSRPWFATGQTPPSAALPTGCPDDPTLTFLWADGARVTSGPPAEHVLRVRDCGFDPPRQLVAPGDRLRLGNDRSGAVVVVVHSGPDHVEIPLPPRWTDAHW